MSRKVLLLAVAGCGAVLVLGLTLLSDALGANKAPNEQRVAKALAEYQAKGLFVNDILGGPDDQYMVPQTFQVPAGMTQAEFADYAKTHAPKPEPPVSASAFLDLILGVLTKDTPFENKVRVNAPPKDGWLNIYFLSSDPWQLSTHFSNNCSYIGWLNCVICDANFVKAMMAKIDRYDGVQASIIADPTTGKIKMPSESEMKEIRGGVKRSLLLWILGHETGHAIYHRDFVLRSGSSANFHDVAYDLREQQADGHVIASLHKSPAWAGNFLVLMNEFLEHEYRSYLTREQRHQLQAMEKEQARPVEAATRFSPIYVSYSPYAVPLLWRVANMLANLADEQPGLDDTGYYDKVRDGIVLKRVSWVDKFSLLLAFVLVVAVFCLVAMVVAGKLPGENKPATAARRETPDSSGQSAAPGRPLP